MPGAGITHAGQTLINSQYMCFVARVIHAINVNAGRFSPGCPQSYDDTAGNAGDLVAAVIVKIPVPEALRDSAAGRRQIVVCFFHDCLFF